MRVQQLELITCADSAVNRISSRNKPECLICHMTGSWKEKKRSYITSSCQGAKQRMEAHA